MKKSEDLVHQSPSLLSAVSSKHVGLNARSVARILLPLSLLSLAYLLFLAPLKVKKSLLSLSYLSPSLASGTTENCSLQKKERQGSEWKRKANG